MITVLESLLMVALTWAIIAIAAVADPRRANCPAGWHVEGVRPSGATTCRRAPQIDTAEDDAHPEPDPAYGIAIHCTGGTSPIVVDERTVGCQRGGWR